MELFKNLSVGAKIQWAIAMPVVSVVLILAYITLLPQQSAVVALVLGLIGCIPGIVMGLNLSRYTGIMITDSIRAINAIAKGESGTPFHFKGQDDLGHLAYRIDNLRASYASAQVSTSDSAEKERLFKSLEVCNTNMMVADSDLNIVYMNKSVNEMMSQAENELQKVLPNFDARSLVGKNADIFHENPQHQRQMVDQLRTTYETELEVGNLIFGLIATPLFGDSGNRLGTVIEWQDKTEQVIREREEQQQAAENLRIKQALDVCDTSVMMADADLNIIYVNKAVEKMLGAREQTMRSVLPNFNVSTLVGTNVDTFHKDPSHQRGMLRDLSQPYQTNLEVAGLTFGLIATPLFNDEGERLGTVVEWDDKTERLAKEKEEQEQAASNLRIKQALDVCDTSVMMADADLNIIYVNKAVEKMLGAREQTMRSVLPNFDVATLVGTNVDTFHKNPSHQRGMLKALSEAYQTDLEVAGLTFGLIATPLYNPEGERLGTVVEWDDKTERLAREKEEREQAASNLRIKQALDVCDTSVMMADADLNIIYVNKAVEKMLGAREQTMRSVLPNFDVRSLVGTNVDTFHKNPAHQRNMLKGMKDSYSTDLEVAGLTFGLIATPLYNPEGERLGTVVEWQDKTERLAKEREEQRQAAENQRVKQALDNVSANVMIADLDFNIIYTNDAVQEMMRVAESDIRKQLTGFDASALVGTNVDIFHKDPSHQRSMVASMTSTYRGEIEVGGRTFGLIANPITLDGNRIGTVVEWADRTAEVAIEREIDEVVESAGNGNFTRQVSLENKEGFFKNLGKGLNTLLSNVEVALNDILRMLGSMAKGDLTERITRDYEGSFGQLKSDANETADKLTEIIANIRASSMTITSAASEIAQGNTDLSQRTEEQASSLEETASSMEEMTSTVKQSAENALQASSLAGEAQNKAQEGGNVVSQAVSAMDEINASSKKISDIIGVIDEIAFQTNLLALNAAVEAARAGEQGRGFAVVAGEVRNLAQRSAGAAKEIKDLIRDSVVKVDDGTQLVNQSGETLQEIVEAVEKVSSMMHEISDAAQEQTSGIEQVNTAVSQMDEMTQQNAALVEEASAAAESMADQAKSMARMIEFFSIDEGGSPMSSAPQAAAAAPAPRAAAASAAAKPAPAPKSSAQGDDEWEDF